MGSSIFMGGRGGGGTGSEVDVIKITNSDFTGNTYQDNSFIGLIADVTLIVNTDEGSGVLLKVNDGYTFDSGTGTITTSAGNYRITTIK